MPAGSRNQGAALADKSMSLGSRFFHRKPGQGTGDGTLMQPEPRLPISRSDAERIACWHNQIDDNALEQRGDDAVA